MRHAYPQGLSLCFVIDYRCHSAN